MNFETRGGGAVVRLYFTGDDVVSSVFGGLKYTQMMNVVTWKAAYCLFPKMTIRDRVMCLINMGYNTRWEEMVAVCRREVRNKYVLVEVEEAMAEYFELRRSGFVGDEHSLVVEFENVFGVEGLTGDGMDKVLFSVEEEG